MQVGSGDAIYHDSSLEYILKLEYAKILFRPMNSSSKFSEASSHTGVALTVPEHSNTLTCKSSLSAVASAVCLAPLVFVDKASRQRSSRKMLSSPRLEPTEANPSLYADGYNDSSALAFSYLPMLLVSCITTTCLAD